MVYKTPSGYEVTLKDNFTYGDYRKIVKSFLRNTEVDFNKSTEKKAELKGMSADKLLDYQEYALDVLIVKIVRDGKEVISNFKVEIDNWPMADGEAIYKEIEKVLAVVNKVGEKKE